MARYSRFFTHIIASYWQRRRQFPEPVLAAIAAAIQHAEAQHAGEIRFAIEAALRPVQLMHGVTARERALEVFSELRVWDTQHNSGVLIYVLLGDRAVEIVADRGIHASTVQSGAWDRIMVAMQDAYAAGNFVRGSVAGVEAVAQELIRHFPLASTNPDELPNDVVLL